MRVLVDHAELHALRGLAEFIRSVTVAGADAVGVHAALRALDAANAQRENPPRPRPVQIEISPGDPLATEQFFRRSRIYALLDNGEIMVRREDSGTWMQTVPPIPEFAEVEPDAPGAPEGT